MNQLICPHCHTEVNNGVKVCRGCQAEVEYGIPQSALGFIFVISIIIGFQTTTYLPNIFGWIVGIISFILELFLIYKIFKNRIVFKRNYNTK